MRKHYTDKQRAIHAITNGCAYGFNAEMKRDLEMAFRRSTTKDIQAIKHAIDAAWCDGWQAHKTTTEVQNAAT